MQEEESKKQTFSLSVWRKIIPSVKGNMPDFVKILILTVLMAVIDITLPLIQSYIITNFVEPETLDGYFLVAALYFVFLVLQSIFVFLAVKVAMRAETSIVCDLRRTIFNKYQRLPVSYFNNNSVGYLVAKTCSDTERIGAMAWRVLDLSWSTLYLLGIFIPMFFINPRLALIMLAVVPVALIISFLFSTRLLKMNRKIRKINSEVSGALNEGITGAKTAKTLVAEDLLTKEFSGVADKLYKGSNRFNRVNELYISLLGVIGSFAVAGMLAFGGLEQIGGAISLGDLSVFLSYSLSIVWPIMQIANNCTQIVANQANAERFTSIMEEPELLSDRPDVIQKYGDSYNPIYENWEDMQGDIEFKNVSFKYPGSEKYILKDFNLKIPKNSNVAIVGETGAGKTTIVNLLCRFYEPTEGQILIDGKDYRERSRHWLSCNLGYVLQTPHLFSGTILDNIKFGSRLASDEDAVRAAKLVSCDKIAEKFEKGFDTQVGECGDKLSTGEKQIITFARAIAANARLLILDEATSSIDTASEQMIQNAISAMLKKRTAIIIAHRLSTIKDADNIIVVENGEIIEQGNHNTLIRNQKHYYNLYSKLSELEYADLAFKKDKQ